MKVFAVALDLKKLKLEDGAKIPMKNGRFWNLRILNLLRSSREGDKIRRPYYERYGFEAEKTAFQGEWVRELDLVALTRSLAAKTRTFMEQNDLDGITALVDFMYDDCSLDEPIIAYEDYKFLEHDIIDKVEKFFDLRKKREGHKYKYNAYYSMDAPMRWHVQVAITRREDGENDVIISIPEDTFGGGRTRRRGKRKKSRCKPPRRESAVADAATVRMGMRRSRAIKKQQKEN
jgi:hypothetical protein